MAHDTSVNTYRRLFMAAAGFSPGPWHGVAWRGGGFSLAALACAGPGWAGLGRAGLDTRERERSGVAVTPGLEPLAPGTRRPPKKDLR